MAMTLSDSEAPTFSRAHQTVGSASPPSRLRATAAPIPPTAQVRPTNLPLYPKATTAVLRRRWYFCPVHSVVGYAGGF